MSVAVTLPESLRAAIEGDVGQTGLSRWALEAMVLEAVRKSLLSTGEAGEILGLGYFQTEALLKERGVPVVLTAEDGRHDEADLRRMFPDLFPA